jgi:O-antigen biosynthesis protein
MNATLITRVGVERVVSELHSQSRKELPVARARIEGKTFARDGRRLQIQGVTYGPFAPDTDGNQFPSRRRVRDDFVAMREASINAIRTYHVPPNWLLDLADEHGMNVFVDVPWRKHVCFLDSAEAQAEARKAVAAAAERGARHPAVLAYSIGNEVPPDVVRWHGARRVERFLAELADVSRQADPEGLVTYASYPPTEYLDTSAFDFATFNVYLHHRQAFHRYLVRLQNLIGDKPLVLGELGMDTFREGELAQADFLAGHVREARLQGLAGLFVFSWTDDWFTGGHKIEDWAFGITGVDRSPKAAFHALREAFTEAASRTLPATPRVSVVVCTYNGGRTLGQCLQSLQQLDYPNCEVIVVDDGSTDDTRDIVSRFPRIKAVHQTNQGLSAARNAGLRAASGEIVAYTDSDCFADRDWLTLLVAQLMRSGAAAVGGPNLTPEDGWLAACVAAAPGQPTHVLESDQVAEHIPGCNMAFRKEALLAINGFDPLYRKAGDDVDVCWRLQQAGLWITFAPGAFVWHHRRQGPRAYLRQQAGYGEAEALLRFHHPERFNERGDGKWRGSLYGAALHGLCLARDIIYRGTFGTALFQCIYRPGASHWAMLPSTLEWHTAVLVVAICGVLSTPATVFAGAMLFLSVVVAALQAAQVRLAPVHDGPASRLMVALLCYLQPLVRSWNRYKTRFLHPGIIIADDELPSANGHALSWTGSGMAEYWTEKWTDRTELLNAVVHYLTERRWAKVVEPGWTDRDLVIYCHPWTEVRVCSVQEDHGSGRRLIRIRFQMCPRASFWLAIVLSSLAVALAAGWVGALAAVASALVPAIALLGVWRYAACKSGRAVSVFDHAAAKLELIRCQRGLVEAAGYITLFIRTARLLLLPPRATKT